MSAVGIPVDIVTIGAALWAAGFSASFIGSMVGAGGGLIIIPIMHMIFMQLGLDSSTAMLLTVGTSAASMIVIGPRAIFRHARIKNIDWSIARSLIVPVLLGAAAMHMLGISNDGNLLKIVFAAMALLVGVYMLLGQERWRFTDKAPSGPTWWALGAVIGFLCPLVGVTGTIIAIPAMVACGMTLRRAIGTGSVLSLLVGIPACLMYATAPAIDFPLTLGAISLPAVVVVCIAGYIGTPLGIAMQQKIPAHILRIAFASMLFISAGRFIWLSVA